MLRIALFAGTIRPLPPPGYGAERQTYELAVALQQLGHEVSLVAPIGSTAPTGIHIIPTPQNDVYALQAVGKDWYHEECAWALREGADAVADFDVVHDMSCSAILHEVVCGKFRCQLPHLYTTNGISWTAPVTARHNVVVISERARQLAARGAHCWTGTRVLHPYRDPPLPSTRVVRYGVDLDFYRPVAAPANYVVYVGRPHEHKGTGLIPLVAKACSDLNFKVAWRAEEPDHKKHETAFLVAAKGVSNLEFVELPAKNHHAAKRDILANAAAMLHPAVYHDALPVAPIEAQACGTPIAAFDRGGVSEILKDGETGVLAKLPSEWPEGSSVSIAVERITIALRQALQLDRAAVRNWAEVNWSRHRMAEDYTKLYEEVIAGGRW